MRELKISNTVVICLPLINVLIESLHDRFDGIFHSQEHQMAMAMHPHFRLLLICATSEQDDVQKRIKTNLINMVKGFLNKEESNVSSSGEEVEEVAPHDHFFGFLYERSTDCKQSATKLFHKFLTAAPQRQVNPSCFAHKAIKDIFIKSNTALPSSAAIERVFSNGKDNLKPKRARLSNTHFEMFLFFKAKN